MKNLTSSLLALTLAATACSEGPSVGFHDAQADASSWSDGTIDSSQPTTEDPCKQVLHPALRNIRDKGLSVIQRVEAEMKLHPNEIHPPSMQMTGYDGLELTTPDGLVRLTKAGSSLGATIIREQPGMTEFVWSSNIPPSQNQVDGAFCADASYGFEFCEQTCQDHYSGGNTSVNIPCQPTPTVDVETSLYGAGKATPTKPMQSFEKAPADEAPYLVECLNKAVIKAINQLD